MENALRGHKPCNNEKAMAVIKWCSLPKTQYAKEHMGKSCKTRRLTCELVYSYDQFKIIDVISINIRDVFKK